MNINVLEYLEKSADLYSGKSALVDDAGRVTYGELRAQAQAMGSHLAKVSGGRTGQPIAVSIDRNVGSLVAFLGVVYSGNFYVPLDLQMPAKRIELMLRTLQAETVVVRRQDGDRFRDMNIFNGRIVCFEEAVATPVDAAGLGRIRDRMVDTDPLYAVFTSGSTGVPKGVVVCHRSVIDLVEQFTDTFGFTADSVFGNQAPFDFDVSVKDIYLALKNGATLRIIPKMMFAVPVKLVEHLIQTGINTIIWATSALRIIANLKALDKTPPVQLTRIMFSGEVMPNKVLNYWRRRLPGAMYVNLYGPTEITCNCTYYKVERSFEDQEVLPIGVPFRNTDILLLNAENQRAGPDEIGEICVRGTSLALGYYNNRDKTAEAFCQNPLNLAYPELIYRTGDLGKYNAAGELLFLSRKDFQIKHMGHRIELGEIEVALNALPFLDAAACLYDEANEKIVLFYQAAQACDKEIVLALRESLPKYMTPNRMVHYVQLPMNKNGKIDRVKLKEIHIHGTGS